MTEVKHSKNQKQTATEGQQEQHEAEIVLSYPKRFLNLLRVNDSEDVFRIICIFIAGLFSFFIRDLLRFREYASQQGIWVLEWSYCLISFCTVFILFGLKSIVKKQCYNWVLANLSDQYVDAQREFRTKKILKWIFDTIYYTSTTCFSLWAFHTMVFMPWYLGGSGSCEGMMKDYPQITSSQEHRNLIIAYNMFQFGNHLFTLIELVFFRKQEELKYYEYTLHHFMASGLIFYSCYFNFMQVSTLVLVLHDIGDIILAGGRAYLDMRFKHKILVNLILLTAVIVWIGSRNFIYPACIIHSLYEQYPIKEQALWDIVQNCWHYMFVQLILLFIMHCYWTLFLIKTIFNYITKTMLNNLYDNKELSKVGQKNKQQ